MPTWTALTKKDTVNIRDSLPGPPLIGNKWVIESLCAITGWACRWLDLLILEVLFVAIVAAHYFQQTEFALADLLQLRVSLRNLLIAATCVMVWRSVLRVAGLYDLQRIKSFTGYIFGCIAAVTGCALTVVLVERAFELRDPEFSIALSFWAASLTAMAASRVLLLTFDRSIRPHLRAKRNLLIVGTGSRAIEVYREMKANRDLDYHLVGYIDSEPQAGYVPPEQVIGSVDQLVSILMRQVVDEVIITLPMKSQYQIIGDIIATCEQLGVQSQYFTHHFGTSVTKKRWATGREAGRMALETVHHDSRCYLKRFLDFFGALFGLLALSPLLLATAIAVKLTSPGPILFCQQRFGFKKREFAMLKFRSMVVDAETRQKALEHLNELSGPAFKIANDPRVTPIGKFLRKMSIDELPQLVNVLLGDMSLVGPRPLPLRDVDRFSEPWLMRRFSVKPGLTCLWQASGRSSVTDFGQWVQMDLEYIDNWSLSLDLDILLKTVPAVLKGRGAS